MIDGDACRRIVTARALDYMLRNDPKDRFLAGDNYEVNYDAFDSVKKTLIRIYESFRHENEAAAAAGINYVDLCLRIIELSRARTERKA